MKFDLTKVLPDNVEAGIIEVKEKGGYLLHVKSEIPLSLQDYENIAAALQDFAVRAFPEETTRPKFGLLAMPDLEFYRVDAVERWAIVNTDNFGGDYPNEHFVGEPYLDKKAAETEADRINGPHADEISRYHKVVKLPYKLQPGFEA